MPHSRSSQSKRNRNRSRRTSPVSWAVRKLLEIDSTVDRRSHVDGSGSPEVCQWNSLSLEPASIDILARVASAISNSTVEYLVARKAFFDAFFSADRAGQSTMASEWTSPTDGGRSLLAVAEDLAVDIARILGDCDGKPASDYLVKALEPSPLRALMLRRLLELSAPPATGESGVPEDTDICTMVHDGVPIGLHEPVRESPAWPPYSKGNVLKSGEPDHIQWPAKDLELLSISDWPTGRIDEDMLPLFSALLEKELAQGRLKRVDAADAEALTRVSVIWKPGREGSAIRQLDDFRRSGINQAIKSRLHRTIALPRFRDVYSLLADSFRSSTSAFLEWDIQAAFRLIPVCIPDRPALTFLDPRDDTSFLQHTCLPFGLVTSPALFCRFSGGTFRLFKRLLTLARRLGDGGKLRSGPFAQCIYALLYVDDVTVSSDEPRFTLVFGLLLYAALGIALEFSKVHALRQNVRMLGFRADLDHGDLSLSIPGDRLTQIVNPLRAASSSHFIDVKTLETLIGRLVWCSSWLVQVRPKLASLYELKGLMASKGLRSIRLSDSRCHLFAELADFVSANHAMRVARVARVPQGRSAVSSPCEYLLVTDASVSGMGGVFFPRSRPAEAQWFSITSAEDPAIWDLLKRSRFPAGETPIDFVFTSGDVCYLELFAMVLGLHCIQHLPGIPPCYVTWVGDNEPAVNVVNSFKSRSASLRFLLSVITSWAPRLEACHLPGARNEVADLLSRSLRSTLETSGVLPSGWTKVGQSFVLDLALKIVSMPHTG